MCILNTCASCKRSICASKLYHTVYQYELNLSGGYADGRPHVVMPTDIFRFCLLVDGFSFDLGLHL